MGDRGIEVGNNQKTAGSISITDADESIAVVLTTYNDAAYLQEALSSVFAQKRAADEVIVVDDGSDVSPASIIADFPQAILLRKPNGGLASARNLGLQKARSRYITFLDADDRLEPNATASGLACFAHRPDAALVYGGHRRIHANGDRASNDIYQGISKDAYADMLAGNRIGMHATVLYRRDILLKLGGFDEGLRRCEDYDLYLRIARSYPIASHPETIAEYRWHGQNMSRNTKEMLRAALAVHNRYRGQTPKQCRAWQEGRRIWKAWYSTGQYKNWDMHIAGRSAGQRFKESLGSVVRWMKDRLRNSRLNALRPRSRSTWPPRVGCVDFGQLSSTRPISLDFGWDRGTPVDRYYIENFLADHAGDITGRVLEIGDDAYSRRYGSKISRQDVLHIDPRHSKATLFGDLTQPEVLPEGAFDCIVLTQTLQLIFDLEKAVTRLHAALKSGGILLLTVPGISPIDRGEWASNWCWSFTETSIRRLFQQRFAADALEIEAHGNVFAATAFLQGVALEEVDRVKLNIQDEAYPVIITLRGQKR
ncbi:MAG TPA: glycosyltransferase [Acidisarcina sp.]|nr:glycosyltransferase [Acidisarcina sp.]